MAQCTASPLSFELARRILEDPSHERDAVVYRTRLVGIIALVLNKHGGVSIFAPRTSKQEMVHVVNIVSSAYYRYHNVPILHTHARRIIRALETKYPRLRDKARVLDAVCASLRCTSYPLDDACALATDADWQQWVASM